MQWLKTRVKDLLAKRFEIPEVRHGLMRLRDQGFTPKTVFDVGAYKGEFAALALDLWPLCRILCFEPLPDRQNDLNRFKNKHDGVEVYPYLLGSSEKESVTLNCAETASSVLVEHYSKHNPIHCLQRTLDSVSRVDHAPALLKLDVQGYELEVLKGAVETLAFVEVILAEINFLDIHIGVALHAEITAWLSDHGFAAYDICSLIRRPLDRALWQADMIFVRTDSALRADKRWVGEPSQSTTPKG